MWIISKKQRKNAKIKKSKTEDLRYIYQNELDKACFQIRRKSSDKVLRDKAFDIVKNPKYDQYQRSFASMIYEFFDKRLLLNVPIDLLVVVLKMRIYQASS